MPNEAASLKLAKRETLSGTNVAFLIEARKKNIKTTDRHPDFKV